MNKFEKNIKQICELYINSKGEQKEKERENLISILKNLSLDKLKTIIQDIKSFRDLELNVEINEIYEKKMLEDIEKFELSDPNTYLFKLLELYNKVILCTSQKIIKKKFIRININRAESLIKEILNNEYSDKEQIVKAKLKDIRQNLEKIKATNEEIKYIGSIIDTCDDYYRYQNALLLFNKKQYFNCLEKIKLIKNEENKELFHVEKLESNCYLFLGKKFEEEGNFEKAKEYYILIKNNESEVIRITIRILKNKMDESDKNKEYDKIINIFIELCKLKNDKNYPSTSEDCYISMIEPFYKNLILIVVEAIEKNEEKNNAMIKKKLKEIYEKIKDNDVIKKNINELVNIFQEIIVLKNKKEVYNLIEKNLKGDLSDIKQRLYIQTLINSLFDTKEKKNHIKIINFIIIYIKKNYYLSKDNVSELRNLLKEFNKDLLIKFSELYELIIRKGLDYSLDIFQIIGNIIIKLIILKNKKNLEYSDIDYNLIIKNLFTSFELLIKEQTIDLSNAIKIYEKIIQLEKKNKDLIYIFFSGLILINKKKYEININILDIVLNHAITNIENNNLIELLVDQLKIGKNPKRFDLIPKLLDIVINYYPNEENYLFSTLNKLEIPYEFYAKSEFIESVENYLKNKIYYNEKIYIFLQLIPLSVKTDLIKEKFEILSNLGFNQTDNEETDLLKIIQINSSNKSEKKYLNKLVSNYQNKIIEEYENYAISGIKINDFHLKNIENNLEIPGMFDVLYKILLSQKDMISSLNMNKICNYFSSINYKLFDYIIEYNPELFNYLNLENIVKKLGEDDENQNKYIYQFCEKLNKLSNIPKSIIDILDTYKEIHKDEEIQNSFEENTISLLINKYYKLPKVPKTSEKFLSKILNKFFELYKPKKDYKTINKIIIKIFNLMIKNGIDIGEKNLIFCVENIHEKLLLKKLSLLLSSEKISKTYKNIIFNKLMLILISTEEKQLLFINEIKYFSDKEELSQQFLSFLIKLLEGVDENELEKLSNKGKIYRELLFVLGNLFSLNDNPLFSKLIKIFTDFEKYKLIQKETEQVKLKQEEIFYIYSIYIYMNRYDDINQNCEYFLELSRTFLLKAINSSFKNTKLLESFNNTLKYFEDFNQFSKFSPIRDHFLRQLIYQREIGHENFGNILLSKCFENKKIWKYKGELINGKKWGIGTIYYNNGDIYFGNFVNDLKNGEAIFINKEHPRGIKQIWKEGVLENK